MKKKCGNTILGIVAFLLALPTVAATQTYRVDPVHSEVGFEVAHMMVGKVRGRFKEFEGTFVHIPGDLERWSVEGSIQAASIDTGHPDRDTHLRGPDFLDAEKHPRIEFRSKRFEKKGEDTFCIGNLTIRGVTREVRIPFILSGPVTDLSGKTRKGAEGRLAIHRKDFGIVWNKALDAGGIVVGEDVTILLSGEAVLQP